MREDDVWYSERVGVDEEVNKSSASECTTPIAVRTITPASPLLLMSLKTILFFVVHQISGLCSLPTSGVMRRLRPDAFGAATG